MSDPVRLTSQDYDVWQLATPHQLLQLLHRLGVEGKVIAAQLGVHPPAISMWLRGRRPIPAKYRAPLLVWTQTAWEQAMRLHAKEVAAQPTEALQRAVQEVFGARWNQWKLEVLHQAGTIRKALQQDYQSLGYWIMQDTLSPDDYTIIETILTAIRQKLQLLRELGAHPLPQEAVGDEEPDPV